jgi:hypothetical protein
MTVQFEDLLSVLCPGFELKHATDFQKHFGVRDEKDAKLAFDVLVSYGFDAKVYPGEEKNTAKLYITLPTADMDPAVIEQRLLAAIAYGKSLRDIKTRLDSLCHDDAVVLNSPVYTLTFANAPQGGKQMVISVNPAVASQPAASPATVQPQRSVASQAAQAKRPVMTKKAAQKKDDDGFNQGPTVAKNLYSGSGKKKDSRSEDDWRRRIFLYITGNIATGGAGVMAGVVLLFVAFSFFVLAKGFLCPDFAVEKKDVNRAWYCADPQKKEDPNKPKLPELPTTGNIR